jgi:acetyl esterase/lipase
MSRRTPLPTQSIRPAEAPPADPTIKVKVMIGDLVIQIAALATENDRLRDENLTLRAALAQAGVP